MKHAFRYDSRIWTPPKGEKYVTPEDAAKIMLDADSGASAARLRMLERMGRAQKDNGGAAEARARMLQRENRRIGT